MKYKLEVEISKPRQRVVELFDNVDNLYQWMNGLEKFEPIGGTPGQAGAKSKLTFNMDGRRMEMIETITETRLPQEFHGTYEMKGVFNIARNFFHELPGGKTKYVTEQEFRFKGFMRVIAFLMPGMFKKQTMKHLTAFKNFVESQS